MNTHLNNVILYGINGVTDLLYNNLDGDNIIATTDGSGAFEEQPVLSLEQLTQHRDRNVIICSIFVDDIVASLLSIGFHIEQIFFFHMVNNQIESACDFLISPCQKEDILYAIYDLGSSIATFDATNFAVLAEAKRIELGKKHIHFIVVPKRNFQQSIRLHAVHAEDDVNWRVNHILNPLFQCIKSTTGISYLNAREELSGILGESAHVFPSNFSLQHTQPQMGYPEIIAQTQKGVDVAHLEAPATAKRLVDNYIQHHCADKQIITITMREYNMHEQRNSSADGWSKFLAELDTDKYYPIIIRDTYQATTPIAESLSHIEQFPLASMDLTVRVALYQRAFLNFSIPTGPAYMFYFIKPCPSIVFRTFNEEHFSTSKVTVEKGGFFFEQQPEFRHHDNQRVFWGEENYENITAAFNAFEKDFVHD
ncbi:hypothetical protein [Pseudoalteromonas luteoviolacea]|uniref:Uncharacterized protein n=1 Tax=Pseudoalteromonas luteoviolacea (strain 2ta16) TaxID=1353533 RepID=V4HR75_PSEL2|nr:hypothetical protein [Pseudoalteromonas luteoviolacea]ESP90414.1 hypothetical protein PL2TA16_01517 [Pseudoalteromonas luteoviolacea 2ta16]KZN42018.1 hypothetical protein N483_15205 [Pseudoalteromonas luteoviolacea NCIMB 1944]